MRSALPFLRIEDLLSLHADQVELFGGEQGVRDLGLLDLTISVATGQSDKQQIAECFRKMAR